MHRRLLAFFALTTILLMVLPPVCNIFDRWDKGAELPLVGHDTETTLAVIAFEVGIGIAVAWGSALLSLWIAKACLRQSIGPSSAKQRRGVRATEYLLLLFSPPPWQSVSLRV